jgi:hypothetical protein
MVLSVGYVCFELRFWGYIIYETLSDGVMYLYVGMAFRWSKSSQGRDGQGRRLTSKSNHESVEGLV